MCSRAARLLCDETASSAWSVVTDCHSGAQFGMGELLFSLLPRSICIFGLMKIQNSMWFCPLHSRARELPFDSCAPHIVVSRSVLAARIETAMPQCSHAAGCRNRFVIDEIPALRCPRRVSSEDSSRAPFPLVGQRSPFSSLLKAETVTPHTTKMVRDKPKGVKLILWI